MLLPDGSTYQLFDEESLGYGFTYTSPSGQRSIFYTGVNENDCVLHTVDLLGEEDSNVPVANQIHINCDKTQMI